MRTMAIAGPGTLRCGIRDYAELLSDALGADWQTFFVAFPDSDTRRSWEDAAARAAQADLVLVHYEYGLFRSVKPFRNLFARFMKRLNAPAIVILHDTFPELSLRRQSQGSYWLRDALRDVAYLPFYRTWSIRLYGLADHFIVHAPHLRSRISEVAPCADVSFCLHPTPPAAGKWNPDQVKGYTFISPGFVKAHKGYLEFLQVVASQPYWQWLIAGGPQNEADYKFSLKLRAYIQKLELGERVRVTGYQSRAVTEEMMAQAELAVFPYQQVTGSGAAAWAMGMGMPILSTDLESFKTLLQAEGGLALLPGRQPESWPGLVDNLLSNPERLQQLAADNRQFSALHGYAQLAAYITEIGLALLRQRRLKAGGIC